jgi:putative transposase
MRYRDYKIFAPNNYYHVFNRGVGKQDIFLDDQDFKFFLLRANENLFPEQIKKQEGHPLGKWQYVRKQLPVGAFSMISDCLMPNHFHFLIRQNGDCPISKIVTKISTGYSMYFNKKYERVGGLFQDQFKAVLIENDSYLLWLSAYIHNNPKVAGLVKKLEDYKWSSYLDYIGQRQGTLCDKDFILKQFPSPDAYKKFVEDAYEKIKERKDLEGLFLD